MALPSLVSYSGAGLFVTGGLGFFRSNLAKKLVGFGVDVTIVDSLIPE
jgi:nucleoside-diphosphate-sugar epimerase